MTQQMSAQGANSHYAQKALVSNDTVKMLTITLFLFAKMFFFKN